MNNPTFLATVHSLESEELQFIESSSHKNANAFALELDQQGYIVKDVIGQDTYKMW